MHPVPGRRIFGCFGSNFALTGVSGALSGVCPFLPKSDLISAETPLDFVGGGALHIVGDMIILPQPAAMLGSTDGQHISRLQTFQNGV